jgi:hypothetical protein
MQADSVEGLLRKIEICDRALTTLASADNIDRSALERAIRNVRADAVGRLRALGQTPPEAKLVIRESRGDEARTAEPL